MAGRGGKATRGRSGSLGARGASGGNTLPSSPSVSSPSIKLYPCGTCSINIGEEDSVQCELCSVWTHGAQRCSGLPPKVFRTVVDYSEQGLTYVCTSCRVSRDKSGARPDGNKQLFDTVRGLSEVVSDLMSEVKQLKVDMRHIKDSASQPLPQMPAPATVSPSVINSDQFRNTLREEIVEIREREKRTLSIIIRGLGSDVTRVQCEFDNIVTFLLGAGKSIVLQDISPINPNLVRAKLSSIEIKRELLNNTKKLNNSQFKGVYISRDLTYKQRVALKQRAQARQVSVNTVARPTLNLLRQDQDGTNSGHHTNPTINPTMNPDSSQVSAPGPVCTLAPTSATFAPATPAPATPAPATTKN